MFVSFFSSVFLHLYAKLLAEKNKRIFNNKSNIFGSKETMIMSNTSLTVASCALDQTMEITCDWQISCLFYMLYSGSPGRLTL